jgi:hypothetical protein
MTDDDLALHVTRSAAPRVDLDEAASALDAMRALGYSFVAPGTPGRYIESDEAHRGLAEFIRGETSLSFANAFAVLDAIAKLGYRIREPGQHPSGLRTTEPAYTKVVPFGARHAAAMKTIERSQFDTNGAEIDKR